MFLGLCQWKLFVGVFLSLYLLLFVVKRGSFLKEPPFTKHNDRGKAHPLIVSRCEMEFQGDEKKADEVGPDLDQMA